MKFLTLIKFQNTARLYDFTLTGGGEASQINYFYSHDITFRGDMSTGGFIYSRENIRVGCQIDTIKNVNGELIMTDANFPDTGATYRITSSQPVFNAFGHREMYKYRLTRLGG